MFLNVSK